MGIRDIDTVLGYYSFLIFSCNEWHILVTRNTTAQKGTS